VGSSDRSLVAGERQCRAGRRGSHKPYLFLERGAKKQGLIMGGEKQNQTVIRWFMTDVYRTPQEQTIIHLHNLNVTPGKYPTSELGSNVL